jgi:hypothetical protein
LRIERTVALEIDILEQAIRVTAGSGVEENAALTADPAVEHVLTVALTAEEAAGLAAEQLAV